METSPGLKKWLWNHDSDGKKIRNESLENAERMVAESAVKQAGQIAKVRSFSQFAILRFYCGECHKNHFWGGPRKHMMGIDRTALCPKRPKTVEKLWLDKVFDNVHWMNALDYATPQMRHIMIAEHKKKNIFNESIK